MIKIMSGIQTVVWGPTLCRPSEILSLPVNSTILQKIGSDIFLSR